MSVFLTPELKPFLGGTYFPPEDSFMRPGFATVLRSVAKQVGRAAVVVIRPKGKLVGTIYMWLLAD